MSAEASDMSGWMLMGLPGYAYLSGVSAFWIALGLAIGTWINWAFIAKRLRIFTHVANNSITLPEYFENRFMDQSKRIRMVCSIFIFIFFLIYTSASFVAGGKLFNTAFGLDYQWSLLLTAGIVVFYTFVGGFSAVCWSDFFQGILMFFFSSNRTYFFNEAFISWQRFFQIHLSKNNYFLSVGQNPDFFYFRVLSQSIHYCIYHH